MLISIFDHLILKFWKSKSCGITAVLMAVFWNSQMLTVDQCFTITAVVWYGAVIKKEKVWQRERKINTHCVSR